MTTIAWINGELAVDSRLTYYSSEEKKILDSLGDEYIKILQPFSLTVKGMPVRAIAIAGDYSLYHHFTTIDLNEMLPSQQTGEKVKSIKEMYSIPFYDQFAANILAMSYVIIVTDDEVFALQLTPNATPEGQTTFNITAYTRDTPIVAGSGYVALEALSQSVKVKREESKKMGVSKGLAARVVAAGMIVDQYSGGEIIVWDGGCCLRMEDVAAKRAEAQAKLDAFMAKQEVA